MSLNKQIVEIISNKCSQFKSPDFTDSDSNYGLSKSDFHLLKNITVTINEKRKFCKYKLIPTFFFEELYEHINSGENDKILRCFTDDIYGIWVYMLFTPQIANLRFNELKYSEIQLDATNIDDFLNDYKEYANAYNSGITIEVHGNNARNSAAKKQYEDTYKLTEEKLEQLQELVKYLKNRYAYQLDKENTNIAYRKPINYGQLTTKEQQEIDKAYEEHKKSPKELTIKHENSHILIWEKTLGIGQFCAEYLKIKDNFKIPVEDDYIDLLDDFEPIPDQEQYDDLFKENEQSLFDEDITPEFIDKVAQKFGEVDNQVEYLNLFKPKNERWSCNNFINNLANRELPDRFDLKAYLRMYFEILSGKMPFKKVHVSKITKNYNAFTSNLLEAKSTCDKEKALIDSLKYNKNNYMHYSNFELCEYIVTDYQRFVFDIDVEFEKTQKVRNGEDIIIEHNYNKETHDQLLLEMTEIKRIFSVLQSSINIPEPKLYAYVMFGTHEDNDPYWRDIEAKKKWCEDIFEGIECIYERNNKATKVISVHIGVSNICYHRNQNDAFRRYLNKHEFENGHKFEMVDSSIYNKTQHAWRFAYSRKNNKRVCQLEEEELNANKEILLNLFAYPDEDDEIVEIPKEFLLEDKLYTKQQSIINSENPIKSYYQQMLFNEKEVQIIHRLNKKTLEDFENDSIQLQNTNTENTLYDSQIDPRLLKALNYVKKNNVGYPNIRKAILYFVNIFRNYYSDQGECVELLLKLTYYHTNGIINEQSTQIVQALVKFGFKQEIRPISHKVDMSIYNKDTVKILSEAIWKESQLKHYLRKMLFKIHDGLYLKTIINDKHQIKYLPITFDKLQNIFNTGFWIMKKHPDPVCPAVKIYRVPATTFIRRITLTEYSGIEIASSDSYNFKNLYDKPIGITKAGNKIYDLREKKYALHDMKPTNRPIQITNILKSILNNNDLDEKQLTERINYFESLFAFKIQNPDIRIDLAPIICSHEGIGKNTYFKILKTVLDNWVQDDLSWDIAKGNFNGNQQLNIIRAYDEVTSTKSALDLMKRLITADTEDVNEKYEKQLKIKNISLKCFLTNNYNNNIISKSGENRRFLYYLPTTSTKEGQQIAKDNWWGLPDKERIKLGKSYFKYLLRLDVSKFDPAVKPDVDYIDDMKEFRETSMVSADLTTQFISMIINILLIPEVNKMTFIPSQLIIDLGLMCKRGRVQLDDFDFDFTKLTEWYQANISSDYTWNQKSLMNRLSENDSIYKPKKIRTTKLLDSITKNKEILSYYLKTEVRGYYV